MSSIHDGACIFACTKRKCLQRNMGREPFYCEKYASTAAKSGRAALRNYASTQSVFKMSFKVRPGELGLADSTAPEQNATCYARHRIQKQWRHGKTNRKICEKRTYVRCLHAELTVVFSKTHTHEIELSICGNRSSLASTQMATGGKWNGFNRNTVEKNTTCEEGLKFAIEKNDRKNDWKNDWKTWNNYWKTERTNWKTIESTIQK